MSPSNVDVFFLTFNCAKTTAVPEIFGSHLAKAFQQGAETLPELVVLSLQEIAPIAYAFLGGVFLSSYLDKFAQALDVAAAEFSRQNGSLRKEKYTLIKSANVGMTAIMLFALDPNTIERLEVGETSFGTADMGNKGAVALRLLYSTAAEGGEEIEGVMVNRRETELTFVATHLAAMEWNLHIRNNNWRSIMTSLLFENPQDILPEPKQSQNDKAVTKREPSINEADPLLENEEDGANVIGEGDPVAEQLYALSPKDKARLHDSTIFKPSSHLFVAGDLNYRIDNKGPKSDANFPSLNPDSEHHHPSFFKERDQLTEEMSAGRTLHGMKEAPVRFPPTYKYNILPDGDEKANPECNTEADGNKHTKTQVWWQFADHRWPSWCDRVLYREVPSSVEDADGKIKVIAYDALPVVKTSDHRGVFLRTLVPLIEPNVMTDGVSVSNIDDAQAEYGSEAGQEGGLTRAVDTRLRLPAPIDREAWTRRQAARKKEIALGWSMVLWGTREGALTLAAGLVIATGGYFFTTRYFN